MKTAAEFVAEQEGYAFEEAIEARDREVRAEEHEARGALVALMRAAHKKELREARGAALREAGKSIRGFAFGPDDLMRLSVVEGLLSAMADRAERGE